LQCRQLQRRFPVFIRSKIQETKVKNTRAKTEENPEEENPEKVEEGRKNLREPFEEKPAEEDLFPYRPLCPIPILFLAEIQRWNELVCKHHYLENANLVGEQLRYGVAFRGQWLALLGWSAASFQAGVVTFL